MKKFSFIVFFCFIACLTFGQKDTILGKQFFLPPSTFEKHVDENTEDVIKYQYGEIWTVDSIAYVETLGYNRERVFLINKRKNTVAIDLKDFISQVIAKKILSFSKFKQYEKGFGVKNMQAIAEESILVGMNKEMVTISWGEPNDINKTITASAIHEQWIYNNHYLYFDNGRLTTIQEF